MDFFGILFDIKNGSKMPYSKNFFDTLFAAKLEELEVKTLTGTLPLTFTSTSLKLAGWTIYGNDNIGKNIVSLANFVDVNTNNVVMTADKTAGTISVYTTDTPSASTQQSCGTFSVSESGNYLLSGVPSTAPNGSLQCYVWDETNSQRARAWDKTSSSEAATRTTQEAQVYLDKDCTYHVNVRVQTGYGTQTTPVIVSPMVRLDGTSSGFEPYTVGVGVRTKNLVDLSNITDSTNNGVTFTVDSANGTITANRTATGTANSTKSFNMTLPAGTYVFSSGENSQRDITYDCYLKANNATIARDNPDDPPGSEFTLTTETTFTFYIRIQSSYDAQNLVFRPMIRPADTSAGFIPYGYEIPLAVTCDRNLFKIYGNMGSSGGVHTIDFNVETSSVTGEMPANSFYQLGFQNAIVKGDETFVISFDKTTAGTAELQIAKGTGSGAEILETFDISEIKSYRVVFECKESFGNVYPRLVATEAATQTFEHLMIKKASDKGGFVPYGAKYEYNVPIDAPLTEGQSVSDTQTIEVFEGENTIDTTLYNKPTMEIKYK